MPVPVPAEQVQVPMPVPVPADASAGTRAAGALALAPAKQVRASGVAIAGKLKCVLGPVAEVRAPTGKLLGCEKVWTRPHRNRFHEVAL